VPPQYLQKLMIRLLHDYSEQLSQNLSFCTRTISTRYVCLKSTNQAEEDIPKDDETGYTNWDCAGSLDMSAFVDAMRYIHKNAKLPPTLESKEDQNELGKHNVPDHVVQIMQQQVLENKLISHGNTEVTVALVDGFLLYSDPAVVDQLDVSLLVRAPYEKLKARREARSGYVTLEGSLIAGFDVRILGGSARVLRQHCMEMVRQRSSRSLRKRRRQWSSD
jgi:hypothetical protein